MNSYIYKITELVRDASGIVVTAHFTVTVSDGTDSVIHPFCLGFDNKPITPTAFDTLTESKVVEWITRDAQATVEEHADAELTAYKKRNATPTFTTNVPW